MEKSKIKNRRLRYGTFSTVMVIVAIALFVLINLVVEQLNISHDLTQDRIFSLSPGSVQIAQELDVDIHIYSLWSAGQEMFIFQQLLEEYASHSSHITLSNRDPILHPHFVEQFAEADEHISQGSIIVVGPERHRVVHIQDLITWDMDWRTGQSFPRAINLEPMITNAINFVRTDHSPVIYHVIGNNEFELPFGFVTELEMAGYEFREVNLLINDIPEDTALLLITMPGRDWSPEQAERVRTYLENNGRAIIFGSFRGGMRFPHFDSVIASFGLRVGDYVIIEGNPNYFLMNVPFMLLPDFVPNPITEPLLERNFMPLFIESAGLDLLEMRRATTTIEPLVLTSNQAFGRFDTEVTGITRIDGDADGPFALAVTVEEHFMIGRETATTRMIVLSCDSVLVDGINQQIAGTNYSFIINSINWLVGEESQIWIPGRNLPIVEPLQLTQLNAFVISAIAVIALPLTFAGIGLIVWLRRKNA